MEPQRKMLSRPDSRFHFHRARVADFEEGFIAAAVVALRQQPAAIFAVLARMWREDHLAVSPRAVARRAPAFARPQIVLRQRVGPLRLPLRLPLCLFDGVKVARVGAGAPLVEARELDLG